MKNNIYQDGVEKLRRYKQNQKVVNTWFYVQEHKKHIIETMWNEGKTVESPAGQAEVLCRLAEVIPVELPPGSVFAGTQDVAFSPSYALINPAFKVETFEGYCDPCAMYNDVVITPDLTQERVDAVRKFFESDGYTKELYAHYKKFLTETCEVAFFMEPVTGHTIPDVRPFLAEGVAAIQKKTHGEYGASMHTALNAVLILAERYRKLALEQAVAADDAYEKQRLTEMADRLERVPREGARTLPEAMQSFILLWEVMVLEQAPNPYAFSVGNMDRIFAPYLGDTAYEDVVAYFRHVLAFFIVGSRGWAISQNIMVGGSDAEHHDLSSQVTDAVLDAFFASNDPQPALSAKIHAGTSDAFFEKIGRFFATPGHSTPSLFNDDSMFAMLRKCGIAELDLADYSIAGCQEPLIMGKSSLNTTNTWLNLGKILELTLNDGYSLLSGKKLAPGWNELGYINDVAVYADLENAFYKMLDHFLIRMEQAGNGCTEILGTHKPVPFTSVMHDSLYTNRDLRDPTHPGVRYHGSGCLIHGFGVVVDSLNAVKAALPLFGVKKIRMALQANFKGYEDVQEFLNQVEKYGNDIAMADAAAVRVAETVSAKVSALRNSAGNPYLVDFSTPSTHLLYGFWVGATPDGRYARKMLGYGIDPRPETTRTQLPSRILSVRKLPFHRMTGGYASHIGIPCPGNTLNQPAVWMRDRVIRPLFQCGKSEEAPYYVYFNLDSTEHLRKILKDPKTYAPSGVYIMRIHGTFVNFLDLSPAIQEDIIQRLEASVV